MIINEITFAAKDPNFKGRILKVTHINARTYISFQNGLLIIK